MKIRVYILLAGVRSLFHPIYYGMQFALSPRKVIKAGVARECTRSRRLCRGVALQPGRPPDHGAARRNPGDDGSKKHGGVLLHAINAPVRVRPPRGGGERSWT